MPFSYNEECTKFDGKICLQTGSSPYDITCTGNKYINVNPAPENTTAGSRSCILAIWGKFDMTWGDAFDSFGNWLWDDGEDDCYAQDFMSERGIQISDDDLCAEETTYTLIRCINRFGLGYLEEDPSTGNFKQDYDERCVGFKTQDINGTSPYIWEYSSERFLVGNAQQVLNLPEGACVQNEPSQIYTIPADPSNCSGRRPCMEIRRYTCVVDTTISTGTDPECANRFAESIGGMYPSLLQDVLFCSANERSVNLRRNGFCATNVEPFRISPPTAQFCEINPDGLRISNFVPNARFCETDVSNLRIFAQNVTFCSLNTNFIRPPVEIPSTYFCSHDPTSIRLQPQSVGFCTLGAVVANARFCEYQSALLRNIDLVSFCEQRIPVALTFAPQLRSQIAPENNVGFCSMSREAVLEDSGVIPSVGFCEHVEPVAVTFCSYPRKAIDGVSEVGFCEYPRKLIDNVPEVAFCETARKLIDLATPVTFCSQDDTMIT